MYNILLMGYIIVIKSIRNSGQVLKLTQLKKNTLTDQVEDKIRQAIINSHLRPGDKLPGELEFAEQLGVSRNIVREAISRLRMLGVVESKKKRGLVLTEPEIFTGLESIIELPVLSSNTINELYDFRSYMELGIAPQVVAKITDEDIGELEKIVKEEEQNPEDYHASVRCDILFHSKLYKITGNEILQKFQALLKPHMENRQNLFDPKRFENDGHMTHRDLLESLKKRDVNHFMKIMNEHLNPSI